MVQYQQTIPGQIYVKAQLKIRPSLCQDHINEIHGKWDSIEDDIWGKVIVMERNRRVAKAYIRSPVITVGGGKEGFDGLRVGLQGFQNPFREEETEAVLARLGGGPVCRIMMDSEGFVQAKRPGKTEVFVQSAVSVSRRWGDTLGRRRAAHQVDTEKSTVMFDMEKLKRNMAESLMYATNRKTKRDLELEVREEECGVSTWFYLRVSVRDNNELCEEQREHPGAALLDHHHQPRLSGLPQDQSGSTTR